jgi:hypothetical protein
MREYFNGIVKPQYDSQARLLYGATAQAAFFSHSVFEINDCNEKIVYFALQNFI